MMNANETSHPFETAGLGKAPFRFIGMIAQDLCYGEAILNRAEYERTGISLTTKPGGTCDYCGTYIVQMYQIESSDGRKFKVGCDCVSKTGDAKLMRAVDAVARKHAREGAQKRADAKANGAREILSDSDSRAKLAALPHPNAFMASKGETLLGWAEWMMSNSGRAGKVKVEKALRAALGAA